MKIDTAAKFQDEDVLVESLLEELQLNPAQCQAIEDEAVALVEAVRHQKDQHSLLDLFLNEFGLDNDEGVALMCLSEALLRVPDAETTDALIADKVLSGDWEEHLGGSDSLFVNASTWGLMLTGKVIGFNASARDTVTKLVGRIGEPVIRQAIRRSMHILGGEFVLGRTIKEAMSYGQKLSENYFSFDMLGEGARDAAAVLDYHKSYLRALKAVAKDAKHCGISVKLSALHARYEMSQHQRVHAELYPRLLELAQFAAQINVQLSIDAEEADRLDLSLELFARLARETSLREWSGLGLVVQAYAKSSSVVLDWLAELAKETNRRFPVRLVKGAYWDLEIKRAQEEGLPDFPVFSIKENTDLAYICCAEKLLRNAQAFYPQFATHNAHTIAAVMTIAGSHRDFEFQRLHGMGVLLYKTAGDRFRSFPRVRVYAPVGGYRELLAYLVRRLLENGANSSFVNRFLDADVPAVEVVRDPVKRIAARSSHRHQTIRLPDAMYSGRQNSRGVDFGDKAELLKLEEIAASTLPSIEAAAKGVNSAFDKAAAAQPEWNQLGITKRIVMVNQLADLLRRDRARLLPNLVQEAKKTLTDAIAELREAEDFCRYYALCAQEQFATPIELPGPTGESNVLSYCGRGVFLCISPWNFPLAIYLGQVVAALVTGNTVIAKPAEQTPRIALAVSALIHEAGIPEDVYHCLPGDAQVGAEMVSHPGVSGVVFTGSTQAAWNINRSLAAKDGPIVPLIAETGGQNAMLVDSTALPEQVTDAVIESAFVSAGQRCSALRILFLQEDIADKQISMIRGAMAQLTIGAPDEMATDVGPVIDEEALQRLQTHIEEMRDAGMTIFQSRLPTTLQGCFLAPTLIELDDLNRLQGEKFGPVLHVLKFSAENFESTIQQVARLGYGLTLGMHSRIDARITLLQNNFSAGNTYVNRNIIGAVVGVQPFGGTGLSGTGPKAGGPNYLKSFVHEQVLTVNTTASGGNVELLRRG